MHFTCRPISIPYIYPVFVSGFTIVRNAVKYDYPVVEAVRSVLPLCDEFVVALGQSDDGTAERIEKIQSPKLRIVHSVWDDSLRKGGRVLAVETDKAFSAINPEATWAFYIQADEVLHEDGLEHIRAAMERWQHDERVEGLLFNYRHFYGSYNYIGDARRWYKREVRVIRNDPVIYSFRDAQGFQKRGRPLRVKEAGAWIHHYGWVKHPAKQQAKQKDFHKLWHSDEWVKQHVLPEDEFDYSAVDSLLAFEGTHPSVMQQRIAEMNWGFVFDPGRIRRSFKERFLGWVKKHTGWAIGEYRNYKLLK